MNKQPEDYESIETEIQQIEEEVNSQETSEQWKDVSTDWQARAEALEQLLRACLLYIKELSDYNWRSAPRTIALQDRAAALGIVVEVKP